MAKYEECDDCGLCETDLPDYLEMSFVFEHVNGHTYCRGCLALNGLSNE